MKRTHVPGLIDVIRLDSPDEIGEMTRHPLLDRRFEVFLPLTNGLFLIHLLRTLSFGGKRFPTMLSKDAPGREPLQSSLWDSLNAKASSLKRGPYELEALARWIRTNGDDNELGILVQQAVGSLFSDSYTATPESWTAALTLSIAIRTNSPLKHSWWALTGKVRKAKKLLAAKVNGNLAGVHGTGVALHNIVNALQRMRILYTEIGLRTSLSAESASQKCLLAPASVVRQATGAGELAGCSFNKNSVFIAELGEAQRQHDGEEVVFLKNSWSRCPAEQWVPALLEGIWRRATDATRVGPGTSA